MPKVFPEASINRAPEADGRDALAHFWNTTPLTERLQLRRLERFWPAWRACRIGSLRVEYDNPEPVFAPGNLGGHDIERLHGARRRVDDVHHITMAQDWMTTIAQIGDGTGVIGGHLILSARRWWQPVDTHAFWLATLLRRGRGYGAVIVHRWIACWPHGVVTLYPTLRGALRQKKKPPLLIEREAAWITDRRLSPEDLDALEFWISEQGSQGPAVA